MENMILIKDRHLNPLNLVLQIEHDTYKGSTLEYVPANGVISDREI